MPKPSSGGKRGGIKVWYKKTGVTFSPELDGALTDDQKIELMKQVESATTIFGYNNAVDKIVTKLDGSVRDSSVYASYSRGTGNVHVNPWYYDGDYQRIAKSYENDVKTGFHPKGTNWKAIIAHETGHAIEDRIGDVYASKLPPNTSFDTAFKYKFLGKGTADIVNRAVKNVKKSGSYGKDTSAYQIKNKLSGYSLKNQSETFAEAIADYSQNGKNSNPLTLEIIKLTKEVLGR